MIYDKLYGFQKEAVDKLAEWGSGILGDEMGLGKTLQCLALLEVLHKKGGKVVIVVPAYLKGSWYSEIRKWKFEIPVEIFSYAYIARHGMTPVQILVCDESHYLKSRKSKRFGQIRKIKAKHVFLLTGTPTPSRLEEIWTQLYLVDRSLRYWPWVKKYCNARESFFGWDVSGCAKKHLPELRDYLETKMIRRYKETVVELPPKVYSVLPIEIRSKVQDDEWARWMEINTALQNKDDTQLDFERKQIVSRLYLLSAQSKVDLVRKITKDLYDAGETFIVFAFHRCLLDAVECPHIRIDGDTTDRMSLVNAFQAGEKRVAALSIRAAGTGLTLTKANKIIFAELTFSPGEMEQACARAHRIGQEKTVNIYYLISTRFDEWMLKKLQKKEALLFI